MSNASSQRAYIIKKISLSYTILILMIILQRPQETYREPSPSPPTEDFEVIKSKQDVPADSPWAGWTGN